MNHETKIISTALIDRPMQEVFEFTTTPRHWPRWHPTAQGVSGATDHSLEKGEQVLEEEKFIFLKGRIRWTMRTKKAPTFWVMDGIVEGIPLFSGTTSTLTYTLSSKNGKTLLHREMTYHMPNCVAAFLDRLVFKTHNEKQSQRAVDRLKEVLQLSHS